jgi:hypothetical protein
MEALLSRRKQLVGLRPSIRNSQGSMLNRWHHQPQATSPNFLILNPCCSEFDTTETRPEEA